jgi:hypothetical protein
MRAVARAIDAPEEEVALANFCYDALKVVHAVAFRDGYLFATGTGGNAYGAAGIVRYGCP